MKDNLWKYKSRDRLEINTLYTLAEIVPVLKKLTTPICFPKNFMKTSCKKHKTAEHKYKQNTKITNARL